MTYSSDLESNCPKQLRVRDHIPMAHVHDVARSIAFYSLLGFRCDSRFSHEGEPPYFASLSSDFARLMLSRASTPVVPSQQAVLFYMYADNVSALREYLLEQGLAPASFGESETNSSKKREPEPATNVVFDLTYPFYMPEGELRLHDPDGYCVLIGQSDHSSRLLKKRALGSIVQIAITVSDVETALDFYCHQLGMTEVLRAGPDMAFVSDGAIRVMLSTPQGAGQIGCNSILYLRVEAIESTYSAVVSRGAKHERAPQLSARFPDHELWIGFIRDPDDNLIGLLEERPMQGNQTT